MGLRECSPKVFALALLVTVASSLPAAAQLSTLRRGAENLTMAPLDFIMSPVVAKNIITSKLEAAEMNPTGSAITGVVGLWWYSTLQSVVSGARAVAGIIEIPVGLALLPVSAFSDFETPPLFKTTDSIVEHRTEHFDFVFGGYYVATP